MAQFIISDFYIKYVNYSKTAEIYNLLFVIGLSITKQVSFFRQVYFYYFMVVVAVVEKLFIKFVKDLHN